MQNDGNQPEPQIEETSASEAELDARHAEKMRKKKAGRDRLNATKTLEKGLLMVHTGAGKGKSTAAFGMIFRALGHGLRVAVVQFVKGKWETGERSLLERLGGELITITAMGEGFTWETQDRQRDLTAAREAWETAKQLIASGEQRLVLLDELNIVLRYDYLPVAEVVEFLRDHKPEHVHVIVTGRNAKPELIEIADLVTEMTLVKHHFQAGVKAQVGIEF
jgi:cob(I)alamin adenosyltransferase